MNILTIGLYFIDILIGVFTGLYAGFSLSYHTLASEKKNKKSKNREKRSTRRKKQKEKEKNTSCDPSYGSPNLLSSRVPEIESYTSFVCDSIGEDSVEHIEKIRKSQDQKYLSKTQK